MGTKVIVNALTVVHKSSGGMATTFPDTCKTPTPAGPIPIPYPNVAQSTDTDKGSSSVKVDGNPIMLKDSNFKLSTGDEAGSAGGGVVSSKIKGKAEPLIYSFDVKVEGKNVFRMTDMMLQNSGSPANTPPGPEVQAPAVAIDAPSEDQDPEIVSAEWEESPKYCGDEVGFEVQVENYPSGTQVDVLIRRESGTRQSLSVIRDEPSGNSVQGTWITRTGPRPENPTVVSLRATGVGGSATSDEDLEIEVPEEARQAGSEEERTVPQMVPQLQPDGSYNYVPRTGVLPWTWNYGHELEIVDGVFKVTCKIKLVGRDGVRIRRKHKRTWKREIEEIWNGHWREHRVNCQRGEECSCPGGCCLFPVQIVCEFVRSGAFCEVNVWEGCREDYRQSDGSYTKQWDSANWFMEGGRYDGARVRSHEFGHAMGLYDEYRDGAIYVPTDDAGAVSGPPPRANVEGSIMGPTLLGGRDVDINENHLDEFHDWFVDQVPDEYQREPVS